MQRLCRWFSMLIIGSLAMLLERHHVFFWDLELKNIGLSFTVSFGALLCLCVPLHLRPSRRFTVLLVQQHNLLSSRLKEVTAATAEILQRDTYISPPSGGRRH